MNNDHNSAFLSAWKAGIRTLGKPSLFEGEDLLDTATDKDQLAPRYGNIRSALGFLSGGELAMVLAMYSFFNESDAQEMTVEACGAHTNILGLTRKLDPDQLRIVADLMVNYRGW